MRHGVSWQAIVTVLVVVVVPFGWLFPLLRSAWRLLGRRAALAPVPSRRRDG
jgi:hypothetical protein